MGIIPLWISADDVKKAEALLTGIGFKKGADGIWVDDKGKKAEAEVEVSR